MPRSDDRSRTNVQHSIGGIIGVRFRDRVDEVHPEDRGVGTESNTTSPEHVQEADLRVRVNAQVLDLNEEIQVSDTNPVPDATAADTDQRAESDPDVPADVVLVDESIE